MGGLHDVEARLEDVAENVTHLRPGLFFENLLWHVDAIREWARIMLPVDPSRRFPMIAARDIGRIAAAGWQAGTGRGGSYTSFSGRPI